MISPIEHHKFEFFLGKFGPITGFGIAMMAAFGVAHWVAQMTLEERGDDIEIMNDVTFAALIGTIIGGKVYFAINEQRISALFSRAGFVYWGGFIGSVLLAWIVIRWRKQSFLRVADGAAVGIAAGYAIGRTGCWAVGDDYGRPWNGFLAVAFPEGAPPSTAGILNQEFHANLPSSIPLDSVVSVYPTQLLEVALGFVMFVVLWRLRRHTHGAGWLFGMYCLMAGIERFIVEFFRAKSDMVGPLTSAQLVALVITVVGVVLLTTRRTVAAPLAVVR
ncbi:MAG TPA: prolipoprotein diacylglyceryl transferase family protein [Gemmatimonadaceae bacterium]|jgi:phosphatidylglycerol:prolipoprotein diacylglycerol transferase|nr:prolipoprotein diacylglyceryl transferase family protein [Gemmatimonadaceae bacterium]